MTGWLQTLRRISAVALGAALLAVVAPSAVTPATERVTVKHFVLSDPATETYRWAYLRHRAIARTAPSYSARAKARIAVRTPELYRNVVQVLRGVQYNDGTSWIKVRLAILPNGSTGWVPRRALSEFQKVRTRLVINHSTLRATLYKRGRPIFKTVVGVGQSHWPTPRGWFYVREKLTGYFAPTYGPRAFGLNARSAVLTDWPGGGFIGIHGTNEPQILPGRVSHGCVRMRNGPILRLYELMPLGTPVQII
jgi:lipoprotein-anchoring transpeptidase ErfK/SrfK